MAGLNRSLSAYLITDSNYYNDIRLYNTEKSMYYYYILSIRRRYSLGGCRRLLYSLIKHDSTLMFNL
jgi:hypothetical protein